MIPLLILSPSKEEEFLSIRGFPRLSRTSLDDLDVGRLKMCSPVPDHREGAQGSTGFEISRLEWLPVVTCWGVWSSGAPGPNSFEWFCGWAVQFGPPNPGQQEPWSCEFDSVGHQNMVLNPALSGFARRLSSWHVGISPNCTGSGLSDSDILLASRW